MVVLPASFSALKAYDQFIIWKSIQRPGKPKPDKVPHDVRSATPVPGNPHDPALHMSYATVRTMQAALGAPYGIGFVFTRGDPFFFIDLDDCVNDAGEWSEVSRAILSAFSGACMEWSISRRGAHIFGRYTGHFEHSCKNVGLGLELYTEGRFAALTGRQWPH